MRRDAVKDPNYAPVYCALYPGLAEITRKHGYALAIHGTLGRDMDLICVPWADAASEPDAVLDEITSTFAIRLIGGPPTQKNHGRLAYTISVAYGECAIDLSFLPRATKETP
jgi:hypothetical protein